MGREARNSASQPYQVDYSQLHKRIRLRRCIDITHIRGMWACGLLISCSSLLNVLEDSLPPRSISSGPATGNQ